MTAKARSPKKTRGGGGLEDLTARVAAALPQVLPSQRWFGSKGRRIASVTPLDRAAVPGTAGALALFHVAYADGSGETYLIPVLPGSARRAFRDALDSPAFCTALVEQIRLGQPLPGRRGTFRFTPTGALGDMLPAASRDVARLPAEQSNTSVVFDGKAILKLYRKLEPGPNPDFEIMDFLTRQTAFRGAPRLGGSITYETPGEAPTTLGVLQEFVPNQGDAWTATQTRLAEYYGAAVTGSEGGGEPDPAFARALAAADAKEARSLGALTGRLHVALASGDSDPDLAPEPVAPADLAAWQEGMQSHLDRVMGTLAAALDHIPEAVRQVAQGVLNDTPRFREGLAALEALGTEAVTKIRIHGDYHLGQVLKVGDEFVILDFEGEPARPLAERRAKQCPLKDVAGMLRSFAYAARAAMLRAAEAAPEDPDLMARLVASSEAWEAGVRNAFLEGYLAETWERGASFLPRGREVLEAVLRAFELDKAVYELHYEINHRPTWVRIPLEGLRRAVAAGPKARGGRLQPSEGPFRFVACLELREIVGARAENERRLAELIEKVPLDSIYYHTHGFFLRHKFLAGLYPNDFATWVAVEARDPVLGERLAMVDPAEFPSLQALREELVSVIDDHLRDLQIVPVVIFGEPFDFIQSRIVEIPTGIQARTLPEFRDALLEVDASAIYFHLIEARMRLGRNRSDFPAWVERGLGLPALAAKIQAMDPYAGSLERSRSRLVQLCDEALAEGAGP